MEEVQMLEEFLKSISIVFYEALCCRIFLDSFLRQRFMNKWSNSLFVILLAGFIWGLGCVTQFQDMYVYRTLGIVVGIFLLGTVFYLGKWYKKIFLCGAFYTLLYCVDYFSFVMLSTVVDHRYFGKQCNSDHSCFIVQNDSVCCSAGNQECLEQGEGSTDEGAGMGFDDKFSRAVHDNHARYAVFLSGKEKYGRLSHGFIRDYGYERNHV